MCSCLGGLIRIIITLINIAFFLCGAAMIGIGIWLLVDDSALQWFNDLDMDVVVGPDDPLWVTACAVIITVGALLFVIGFCGCCGVRNESPCLLLIYIILVSVCIGLQVVAIIMAIVFNQNVGDIIRDGMTESLDNNFGTDEMSADPTTISWNRMQFDMECCGSASYTDWDGSEFDTANPTLSVPYTCCKMQENTEWPAVPADVLNRGQCEAEVANPPTDGYQHLHSVGCYYSIRNEIQQYMHILIGICAGIIVLEIFGICVACTVRDNAKG